MLEPNPLVSVLIPARDVERFLPRTLDSVRSQSYGNLEIILVDDGSSDGTADIIAAAVDSDDRVRACAGPCRGISAARNTAAAEATGDLLAPCDADDVWHADKVAMQVEALHAASPETGVVYCWTHGIDEDDRVVFPGWSRKTAEGNVHRDMIVDSLPGSGSAPLIRRRYFEAAGRYPETPGTDDWGLYIALSAICEFAVVPEFLVGYRLRSGGASSDYRFMSRTMAEDTRWIEERWPDTPRDVLHRRAFTVNAYLSFLALRRGHMLTAFRYRLAAVAARPREFFGMSWLGFNYIAILQLLGIQRYYFPFWRPPASFPDSTPSP